MRLEKEKRKNYTRAISFDRKIKINVKKNLETHSNRTKNPVIFSIFLIREFHNFIKVVYQHVFLKLLYA